MDVKPTSSDGAGAILFGESCADQSQTAGDEHGAPNPLNAPGNDELADIPRQPAPGGGKTKDDCAQCEDGAAAMAIPRRAADQEDAARKSAYDSTTHWTSARVAWSAV
jgi:hypothetical protein